MRKRDFLPFAIMAVAIVLILMWFGNTVNGIWTPTMMYPSNGSFPYAVNYVFSAVIQLLIMVVLVLWIIWIIKEISKKR